MVRPSGPAFPHGFGLARPAAVADCAGEMKQPPHGDEVRAHRESAGITLCELGRQIGVSPYFLCDLEAGSPIAGWKGDRGGQVVGGSGPREDFQLDRRAAIHRLFACLCEQKL